MAQIRTIWGFECDMKFKDEYNIIVQSLKTAAVASVEELNKDVWRLKSNSFKGNRATLILHSKSYTKATLLI